MKVTLDIKDDAELRNYIKDCIKGQVLSIVREEFIEAVKAEITRKIDANSRDFNYLMKNAFDAAAKEIVLTKNGITDWSNDFIKPLATEVLNKRINDAIKNTNWDSIVNTLAKEKVKALIS